MNTTTITTGRNGKDSSCILRATYEPEMDSMEVVFQGAEHAIYTVYNVTADEWARFAAAPSLGRAWNRMFYGRRFSVRQPLSRPVALAA